MDVNRSFRRVNIRKALGPDVIPSCVLLECAFQLARVFTDIFNQDWAKTVPSATAEEIQGPTNNPENVLLRGHRKCIDSVHLSVVW